MSVPNLGDDPIEGALVECPQCEGTGRVYWPDDCGLCRGEGVVSSADLAVLDGAGGLR